MPSEAGNRRRRGRGCLWSFVAALAILAAVFAARQAVGRFLVQGAISAIARRSGVRVDYREISGDVYSRPRFRQLSVSWGRDSMIADELVIGYDLLAVLRRAVPVSEIEVHRPRLYLSAGADESAAPDSTRLLSLPNMPRLSLRRLLVREALVYIKDTVRVESLDLDMTAHGEGVLLKASLNTASARLSREGIELRRASGECVWHADTLRFAGLEAISVGSRLAGDVTLLLDGPKVDGELTALIVDLAEFTDQPGRIEAKGRVSVESGQLRGDLLYRAVGLELDGRALPRLSGSLVLDGSDLRFTAGSQEERLGRFDFEGVLDIASLSHSGRARFRAVRLAEFDTTLPDVPLDADFEFSGIGLDTLAIVLGGRIPEFGIDTLLVEARYGVGVYQVSRLEARTSSGRLWAEGRYSAGHAEVRCMLDRFDLGLIAKVTGKAVGGRASGLATVFSAGDSSSVVAGIRVDSAALGALAVDAGLIECALAVGDTLAGRLVVGGERLRWRGFELDAAQLIYDHGSFDIRLDRPSDRLLARGMAAVARTGVECDVAMFQYATAQETLDVDRPFRAAYRLDTLTIEGVEYQVADGRILLEMRGARGSLPRVDIIGESLDLGRVGRLLRLPLEIEGVCGFHVVGEDSLVVGLDAAGLRIPASRVDVKSLGLTGVLTDSLARLDRLWFVSTTDTSEFSGQLAYLIDRGLQFRHFDAKLSLADPGTWVLDFIRADADLRSGQLYGEITIVGTPDQPRLSGRARLSKGQLFVPSVSALLERVNGELTFRDDLVVIEKLSGRAGEGLATASGIVDLGRNLTLDSLTLLVRPEGASVSPMPEVYAVVDGEVRLYRAPERPVRLVGELDVEEALLTFGFGEPVPPTTAEGPGLDLDLQIRADRGVWLRNSIADIELGVDMQLHTVGGARAYAGRLTSRQGNIYYLDNTMRISRGALSFDNIERLNPELDIVAELPIRNRNGEEASLPDRVVLSVGGTLEQPVFSFSSDPPGWDENEIVTYLSLNVTTEELSALENREAITRYLSERFLGYLQTQSSMWVRKFVGLDELRFETELAGGEGYKVTVGKYIGRDLYVTYTHDFAGGFQPEFTVEYYLNRSNEVVAERTADGRYSLRYQYKLRY